MERGSMSSLIESTIEETPTLSKFDRCDSCGVDGNGNGISQAYVKATFPSGLSLLFCAHHANHSIDKLVAQGATILDERKFLI